MRVFQVKLVPPISQQLKERYPNDCSWNINTEDFSRFLHANLLASHRRMIIYHWQTLTFNYFFHTHMYFFFPSNKMHLPFLLQSKQHLHPHYYYANTGLYAQWWNADELSLFCHPKQLFQVSSSSGSLLFVAYNARNSRNICLGYIYYSQQGKINCELAAAWFFKWTQFRRSWAC